MRGGEALREGLATRELRLYVAACAATSLALWAFTVVLAIAAYQAGGTGAVTLAVIARVLPGAIAGPVTALLADRRSRRAVLLALTGGATAAARRARRSPPRVDAPLAVLLVLAAAFSILAERPAARAGRAAAEPRAQPARARGRQQPAPGRRQRRATAPARWPAARPPPACRWRRASR